MIERRPRAVPSSNIGRRLMLIRLLLDEEIDTGKGLGVTEVAERTGREKSQISRALRTLQDAGYVDRDADSLTYSVGRRILQLAGYAGNPALLNAAYEPMELLAARISERVELVVESAGQCLTVETAAASRTIQGAGWVGRLTPMHSSASGWALLSGRSDAELAEFLGLVVPELGKATADEVATSVQAARETGLARYDHNDLTVIAAPIIGTGGVDAALCLSGPSYRMSGRLTLAIDSLEATVASIASRRF